MRSPSLISVHIVHGLDLNRDEFYTMVRGDGQNDETSGISWSPDNKHMYVAIQGTSDIYHMWRLDGLAFNDTVAGTVYHSDLQGGTCIPDPQSCGCVDADPHSQSDYTGTIATTVNGRTCQAWNSQSPHSHTRTPENYPNAGLGSHNYCRNPDGEPRAWCYTTDPDKRWELCAVPFCSTTI